MNYEIVIGLETHVELSTDSKIFCSCGGHSSPKEANDCVCPACSGMPGMLPVMNKRVVELAVTAGLMLNCEISRYTTFDKKNYYYLNIIEKNIEAQKSDLLKVMQLADRKTEA